MNEPWVVESILKLLAGGGGGGTTNYNLLSNKPKINDVELIGNRSFADLEPKWSDIGGDISASTTLQNKFDSKVNKSTTSVSDISIGRDAEGNLYIEY